MSRLEELNPLYVGEDRIVVTLDPNTPAVEARPITMLFDYERADEDGGVVPPLIVTVQPSSNDNSQYRRDVFYRIPTSFTFVVERADTYLITIRESAHNRWQGRYTLEVIGDQFSFKRGRR